MPINFCLDNKVADVIVSVKQQLKKLEFSPFGILNFFIFL